MGKNSSPMFAKTVLENGIRMVSHEMPEHRSVSLGIWVESGSRHETDPQNGISHFIEHLLFKGTERRSAAQIAEEMDAVGGVINAFTSKEHTCYYAKVLDENLPLAIDLLTDIFLHSSFDAEEIERERSVILQEISQSEDTPDDYVHDLFNLDFFKSHPIGRPICGREQTVTSFQRGDFLDFFKSRYRPRRVIVSAAGNFRHDELVKEIGARLGSVADGVDGKPAAKLEGETLPKMGSGVFPHVKSLEQVHLCLGVASYKDIGYLGVYAGTSVESTEEVVELILKELQKLAAGEMTDDELRRTQGQLVGSMMLGLESTDSWMSHIARNEIYFGKTVTTEEICQRIRGVSRDDVVELAAALFRSDAMTLTLLGDFNETFQLKNLNMSH